MILCGYISNIIFTTIFGMAGVSMESECCQACCSCAGDLRGNWFSLSVYWMDSAKMNASEGVLKYRWLLTALFLTQMILFVLQWHPLESSGVWTGFKRKLAYFPLCISWDHELPYFTAAWEIAFAQSVSDKSKKVTFWCDFTTEIEKKITLRTPTFYVFPATVLYLVIKAHFL